MSEGQVTLGGLAIFAIWLFVVLPFVYQTPMDHRAMLELVSTGCQVVVAGIAAMAAIVGFLQLRASNRYELLKKLEDQQVRKARLLLFNELRKKKSEPSWWDKHPKLEQAASTVCATFDIVALMAKYGNYSFFSKEWANTICWTYDALEEYLKYRAKNNPRSYPHYGELYKAAKKWRYK
jgi:hypothetical protein